MLLGCLLTNFQQFHTKSWRDPLARSCQWHVRAKERGPQQPKARHSFSILSKESQTCSLSFRSQIYNTTASFPQKQNFPSNLFPPSTSALLTSALQQLKRLQHFGSKGGHCIHLPHTAWVLSKHICLVLCPPCPKSLLQVLAFFLPLSQHPPQSSATEKIQPLTPENCALPCPPTPL